MSLRMVIKNDSVLYHGTYKVHAESIKTHGLGGKVPIKAWDISKDNVVYLTDCIVEAEALCECADDVPEEWIEEIVIFEIPAKHLDLTKLFDDENLLDWEPGAPIYLEYHGIIPWEDMRLIELND